MKKRISILFIIVILFVFLPYSTSFTYAFFDKTVRQNNINLAIGNWSSQVTYQATFESFINTNTGIITQVVDDLSFELNNVVTGALTTDKKNGTTGGRITQNGTITTTNYYRGYQSISFYVGMSSAGNTNGSYSFNVEISNNGTQWTSILNQSKPVATLTLYTINMSTLLKNGITLADNSVATSTTNLKVRISFISGNASGSRVFNIDDIVIVQQI